MTEVVEFDSYSTVAPLFTSLPQWMSVEDARRVQSYQIYEQIFWNVPETFKIDFLGTNNRPIYLPNARTIVDTTNRYVGKGFSFAIDPVIGTPEEQTTLKAVLTRLFRRERFYGKYNANKRYGLIRGDWCFHIIGYDNKPVGSRIRIDSLDPASYFPVYHPTDPDRLIAVHIVEQIQDPNDDSKFFIKRQTYQKGADPENNDGSDTTIYNSIATFDVDKWERLDLKGAIEIIKPLTALPLQIKAIPVYHIRNFETPGDPFGSSELRGFETVLTAINQGASDEDLALVLEGLGIYYTDAGAPRDAQGNIIPWNLGPGRVVEVPPGNNFARANGINTVGPYQDHISMMINSIKEASATPDAAIGKVDVSVAESGIALVMQMSPMLAKADEKEQEIADVMGHMLYDLRDWFAAYEGIITEAVAIPTFGDKLPKDIDKEIERILRLVELGVSSTEWARAELSKYGYSFEISEGNTVIQEAQARAIATDPFASRVSAELEGAEE